MTVELTVEGMSCDGCESNVEAALADVDGVESVSADRTADAATVEGEADEAELVAAVEAAGYEARG